MAQPPRTEHPVVLVEGLRKAYGPVSAVDGIDLDIQAGEVFALLGPNGAGKTTTVEILEGYRRRDGGRVEVLGTDPGQADDAWRCRVGIVHQKTGSFTEVDVDEIVRHFASFYPDPLRADEVIDLVGLGSKRRSRCSKLSGGQLRRLDVALGIIGNPELVFLDEPTTGLDPLARRQAWELVERLTGLGKTVLLTTHYLDEAEHLADRVAVIVGGHIVARGTPADIGGRATDTATVRFRRPAGGDVARPPDLPDLGDVTVTVDDEGRTCVTTPTPTEVVAKLAAWAGELPELTVTRPTLEDVYLRLVAEHSDPIEEVAA